MSATPIYNVYIRRMHTKHSHNESIQLAHDGQKKRDMKSNM